MTIAEQWIEDHKEPQASLLKAAERAKKIGVTMEPLEVMAARIAHETNRGYCEALGDFSQVPWNAAPDWQRESALAGVEFHKENPDSGPEASHNSWLDQKRQDGWVYGDTKDPEAKTHPCIVPFTSLPVEQQAKDYIFRAVVKAVMGV